MKKILILASIAMSMTSCFTASLITAVSTPQKVTVVQPTTQVVTNPPTTTTTVHYNNRTIVNVQPITCDISYYLNLQAVAAAFAQSRSVWDFEQILNSSSYMINNLDLNRDGYVDYIRVLEIVNGFQHTYLLQDCLAPGVFQDVATILCNPYQAYIEVIGAPALYGNAYIIRPVFTRTPAIYSPLMARGYTPWWSPYYHNHYPSHYTHCTTVYYSHYSSYVTTYLSQHRYFTDVTYPGYPSYNNYINDVRGQSRNDYYNQHPDEQFANRNSGVTNTRQLVTPSSTTTTTNRGTAVTSKPATTTKTTTTTPTTQTTNRGTAVTSKPATNKPVTNQPVTGTTVTPSRSASTTTTTTRVNTNTGRVKTSTSTSAGNTTTRSTTNTNGAANTRSTTNTNNTSNTTTTRSGGGHR